MGGLKPSRKTRKQEKREEAIIRQEYYDSLSVEDKIKHLDNNGYRAKKQRIKLQKLLKNG